MFSTESIVLDEEWARKEKQKKMTQKRGLNKMEIKNKEQRTWNRKQKPREKEGKHK